MKFSLMEGGVRGAATMWSPFTSSSKVLDGLIHISDWLPTLYAAAGKSVQFCTGVISGQRIHLKSILYTLYLSKSKFSDFLISHHFPNVF